MLDLSPLYGAIRVTKDEAGRSAIAPEILMALWLMATIDGIGSAAFQAAAQGGRVSKRRLPQPGGNTVWCLNYSMRLSLLKLTLSMMATLGAMVLYLSAISFPELGYA